MCAIDGGRSRGHDDGLLAAIGPGERDAARRPGRVRGALHDGAARLERPTKCAGSWRRAADWRGCPGVAGGDLRDIEAAAAGGSRRASWRSRSSSTR